MGRDDATDDSLGQKLVDFSVKGGRAQDEADKGVATIGSLGGDDALAGFFSWRQRFFESDRQGALEASDGVLRTELVGRADDDAVEVGLSAQQVVEVVIFRNALIKVGADRSWRRGAGLGGWRDR